MNFWANDDLPIELVEVGQHLVLVSWKPLF